MPGPRRVTRRVEPITDEQAEFVRLCQCRTFEPRTTHLAGHCAQARTAESPNAAVTGP